MKLVLHRSIEINKSPNHVYQIISDLSQWNTWSPWFHAEPTVKTTVSGGAGQIGQTQTWEGDVTGSGKITIAELEKNQKVLMSLEFFKPWKSIAQATFEIKALSPDKCLVIWTIHSHMPLFMIFFKKMMTAYMGSDFDRGLHMLKELAETGTVISKSAYKGEKDFSGFQIVGKKTSCTIAEMPERMQADFANIHRLLEKGELSQPESMVSLYYKYDIPHGTCEYSASLVYMPGKKINVPAGFERTTFSPHKGLLVDYYGPYRNLGNPWAMIINNQRAKKKKLLRKVPMYEIYKTMPDGRPEKDIHTQIVVPIK